MSQSPRKSVPAAAPEDAVMEPLQPEPAPMAPQLQQEQQQQEEEEEQLGERALSNDALAAKQLIAELAAGNSRLEHMNIALEKFLGLVDVATETDKLTAAIPHVPPKDLERLSKDLVARLKSFIITQHVQLVQGFEIDVRLAELNDMVAEANERIAKGLQPESEELKDAWRPHITAELVVLARQIPEQEEDLRRLEIELRELEAANEAQVTLLQEAEAQRIAQENKMRSDLKNLDQVVQAIEIDPVTEKRIHEAFDAMHTEVGPRG